MPRSRIYTFWRNWTIGHPITALSILVVLGILAFQYALGHLRINTDTTRLIAPDAPFQQHSRSYEKAFSQDLHTLLLVVESDTPELTKSASKRLLRLLRDNTDHFNSAYIPYDNEFFRQNGLLYLDTDELESLSDSLSLAQPFIGRIAQETNLTGFFSILEDALKSGDTTRTAAIDLTSLTHKVTLALDKVINGENALLSWESMISGKKTHSSKEFIIVSPKFDYSHIRPAKNAIESINKAIASIQDPYLPAVKVWVTGEVALEDDELAGISTGTFTASIFSVVTGVVYFSDCLPFHFADGSHVDNSSLRSNFLRGIRGLFRNRIKSDFTRVCSNQCRLGRGICDPLLPALPGQSELSP
jgi:predicted RND superfamily exporter protein